MPFFAGFYRGIIRPERCALPACATPRLVNSICISGCVNKKKKEPDEKEDKTVANPSADTKESNDEEQNEKESSEHDADKNIKEDADENIKEEKVEEEDEKNKE